jgi:hypothetical protein
MKKVSAKKKATNLVDEAMLPEYDFKNMKGGVRGKYSKAYRSGHRVEIHKTDGTNIVQHFKLEDGAVVLAPDVREYFPDADSVNAALRCLIPIVAGKQKIKAKA